MALYPNRRQAILRPAGCKSWVSVSKHWSLSDEQIDKAIALEEQSIWGCRWGEQTRFAVFDIDAGSKYHNIEQLEKLEHLLEQVELTPNLFQSSASGGWHLYLYFDAWQIRLEVQELLKAWLIAQGYEIKNGTLEVFPSGNGLRLPLQHGFAWLAADGAVLRRREDLTTDHARDLFLRDLHEGASDWTRAKELIESQLLVLDRRRGEDAQAQQERLSVAGFDGLFNYRLIPEKYQDGRQYWQTGLSAAGQRHDAILAVEHYLWHGDEAAGIPALPAEDNDETRFRLIRAWLEAKHNDFCNHIKRGNWRKVEQQIRRACKWRRPFSQVLPKTPYPLTERAIDRLIGLTKSTGRTWSMEDLKKGNDGREEQAREKIRAALQLLTEQGRRVTGRQIMRLTGCSYHTVKRHVDIWKISPAVLLPRAAGELNSFSDLDAPTGSVSLFSAPEDQTVLSVLPCSDSGDLSAVREAQLPDCSDLAAQSEPRRDRLLCLARSSSDLDPTPAETPKPELSQESPGLDIQSATTFDTGGNCQTVMVLLVFKIEKTGFILPYGSQRRPIKLAQPVKFAARTVLDVAVYHQVQSDISAAAQKGLSETSNHTRRGQKNVPCRSQAVYNPDLERIYPAASRSTKGNASVYRQLIDSGQP